LTALVKLNAKASDLLLPNAKFAYNEAPSRTTWMSPFTVAYRTDPLSPLDLVPRVSEEKPSMGFSKRVKEI